MLPIIYLYNIHMKKKQIKQITCPESCRLQLVGELGIHLTFT